MRVTHLLRAGVVAGAAAGISAAVVMYLLVEPVIRRALLVEEARSAADHGHDELVSRGLQVGAGLATAVVAGTLLGLVFAVVFARAQHALPAGTGRGRAGLLALIGFVTVVLVPALVQPANPPGVGDPATITRRTLLYLLTILLGLLATGLLLALERRLRASGAAPHWRPALLGLAAAVAGTAIVLLVPGSPDPIPADVPADLVWDFRVASLAQLGTQWAVLGLVFGALVDRRRAAAPRPAVAAPA